MWMTPSTSRAIGCAFRSTRKILNFTASMNRPFMIRSLHHRRVKVGYSQRGYGTKPIEIDVKLPKRAEWMGERILSTPLPAGGTTRQGKNVELGDVVTVKREPASHSLFRRDGRFAEMVQAEVAGRFEAPITGCSLSRIKIKKWIGAKADRGHSLSRSAT